MVKVPNYFDPCAICHMPVTCSRHRVCDHVHGSGAPDVFSTDDSQRQHIAGMERGTVENVRYVAVPGPRLSAAPTGWECPRCGTIHAPFIHACACKRDAQGGTP